MIHYHGTPITPKDVLYELAGRHFCVSYASPRDVLAVHRIGQSVMLDNGAFTFWRTQTPTDWPGFYNWVEPWLDYPTTWCVIPDVIDGDEQANDKLLVEWWQQRLPKGAPVWHLHESLERLRRLAHAYERICFGSSGTYSDVGDDRWHRRVHEAFTTIAKERGQVPWVHMLRGMKMSGSDYPFSSVDSTDIAQNHSRNKKTARMMADRWDSVQCPGVWKPQGVQLEVVA